MGLLDRVNARHASLSNPVAGDLSPYAGRSGWGHDPFAYIHPDGDKFLDRMATSDDVFSAVSLRARLMSGLKIKLYRGSGSNRKVVDYGPAVNLLQHVNPFWTQRRLFRMDEMSMGLWGESFWAIEKDQFGTPKEIWWLKPTRVTPVPDREGYIKRFLYDPANGGPAIGFAPDEIVWFRYPNPLDELSPLSPLKAAQRAAETGSAMLDSNKALFAQGLQMGGFVSPTGDKVSFTQQQADDLEAFLEHRFKGSSNAHRWAVLRFDATFKQAQVSPRDAEFANGMNMTLRRVCNVYGIPSPLLNDLEHATLANVESLHSILWADALVPDAELRQEEITEQFLPLFGGRPLHAEFDFSKVPALQESATSVWDRERAQIEVGGLTVNEWRESHGLPSVPWGDAWWAPVNKGAVNGATRPEPTPLPADDQEAAADVLAAMEIFRMEMKHGPLTLNGQTPKKINGHGRVRS